MRITLVFILMLWVLQVLFCSPGQAQHQHLDDQEVTVAVGPQHRHCQSL